MYSGADVWYYRSRGNPRKVNTMNQAPDYNPDDYKLADREKRIKELVDGGMPRDEAEVTVDATLNVAGVESDEQSHRPDAQGNMTHVTRVQAPHTSAEDDPSPDPSEFRRTGPG